MPWNNKGRPTGAGTCSRSRQEKFKEKGEQRAMVKWDKQSEFERDAIAKMAEEEAKKKKAEENGKGKGSGKDQMTPRRNKQEQPKRKEQPAQDPPKQKEIKVEEQGLTFGPSPALQKKDEANSSDNSVESADWDRSSSHTTEKATAPGKPKAKSASLVKRELPNKGKDSKNCKKVVEENSSSSEDSDSSKSPSSTTPPKKAPASSSTLDKRDGSSSLDKRVRKWENQGHLQWKLKENPNRPKKGDVDVDWYGTLFVENNVPDENKDALFRLQRENYRVHLLSFCGYNREKDVRRLAQQLHFPFDSINFTRERKGEGGKADWMLWKGHDIIFEDQMDIIEECSEKGIWVYVVAARSNRDCRFPRYQTFGDAVDAFLAYSSP